MFRKLRPSLQEKFFNITVHKVVAEDLPGNTGTFSCSSLQAHLWGLTDGRFTCLSDRHLRPALSEEGGSRESATPYKFSNSLSV